jgi:hypothetical protein
MNERSTKQLVLEVVALLAVVGVQVAARLYETDADFRYSVHVQLGRLRYVWQRGRWKARWQQLPGYVQEAFEQVHGRQ